MAEARAWALVKVKAGKEEAAFQALLKLAFDKHEGWSIKRIDTIDTSKVKGPLVVAAFAAVKAQDIGVLQSALEEIRRALPKSQPPQVDVYPVTRSLEPNW